MNNNDFNRILGEIKKQSFDEAKLKFIKSTFKNSLITSDQLKTLLEELNWDDSKIELIKHFKNYVVDRYNIYRAIEAVDSSFKRDEIKKYLDE